VVRVLKEVFKEDLDQATTRGSGRSRRRRPQQPLDARGLPRPVTLTLTADDRTNCILGMAAGPLADQVRKVVGVLEAKARGDTKAVQLVPAAGVDPALLQEVLDAIQPRTPVAGTSRSGSTGSSGRGGPGRPRRRADNRVPAGGRV
jgi:hypothetical protein